MKNAMLFAGAYLLLVCPIYAQGYYKVCFDCDAQDYNKSYANTLKRALEQALAECGKDLLFNPSENPTSSVPSLNIEDRELITMLENSIKDKNDPVSAKKIAKDYPGVDYFAIIKLSFPYKGDPFRIDCNIVGQTRELIPLPTFTLNESEINIASIVKNKFVASFKTTKLYTTKAVQNPVAGLREQLKRLIEHEFLVPNDQEVKNTLNDIRKDDRYLVYLELKVVFLTDRLLEQLNNSPLSCKETLRIFDLLDLNFLEIAKNNPEQLQRVKSLKEFMKTQREEVILKCTPQPKKKPD